MGRRRPTENPVLQIYLEKVTIKAWTTRIAVKRIFVPSKSTEVRNPPPSCLILAVIPF